MSLHWVQNSFIQLLPKWVQEDAVVAVPTGGGVIGKTTREKIEHLQQDDDLVLFAVMQCFARIQGC